MSDLSISNNSGYTLDKNSNWWLEIVIYHKNNFILEHDIIFSNKF